MRDPLFAAGRGADWVVLAATSEGSARSWATTAGLTEATIVDRVAIARARGRVTAAGGAGRPAGVVIHSLDWSREEMPQLHLVAVAAMRAPHVYLVDEARSPAPKPLPRSEVLAGVAATAPQSARALTRCAVELGRAWGAGRIRHRRPAMEPEAVVVPWLGSLGGQVGGSVSHAAGILGGMRALGMRVHLVSEFEPPPQLAAAADRVHVLPPSPAAHRLSRDVRRLAGNRSFRAGLERSLAGLDAPMIYSRHQAMATAAADVAGSRRVPLVLEWNASERWAIEHWTRMPRRLKPVVLPAIDVAERSVVRRASVIAAVSRTAAEMASAAGAPVERTIVVPNAADLATVDNAVAGVESAGDGGDGARARVGWVGTFGAWHGARILIEALAGAQSAPPATLIGEGVERADAERLAERLGIAGRIRFRGRLAHGDALAELAACDILVASTVPLADGTPFFGSPTKVFEYMALGRPIVASRLGQVEEILDDGRTGLLVTPGSASELAAALDRLIAEPETRAELGRNARRAIEDAHTWRHRAAAIVAAVAGR